MVYGWLGWVERRSRSGGGSGWRKAGGQSVFEEPPVIDGAGTDWNTAGSVSRSSGGVYGFVGGVDHAGWVGDVEEVEEVEV